MSTETIAEWAARTAPTIIGWNTVDIMSRQTGNPTNVRATALLAYRDRVIAGLDDQEQAVMLGILQYGPVLRRLATKGIAEVITDDGDFINVRWTPFGREIARVLEIR